MIWKIIGVTLVLILVGFIKNVMRLIKLNKNIEFLGQYTKNYVEYCNSYLGKEIRSEEENKVYIKLIREAPKAQLLLMDAGYVDYKLAGTWSYISNYQILINTVQTLRNPPAFGREEYEMLYNILVMQVSRIDELGETTRKEIFNPIILLREGVQFFVTLPISLLFWTGLIKYSTQYKLTNNFFVKLVSFLIIIIGLVSSIFTIVLGWEQFETIVKRFL
ncbi:hypothetical protein SAMN04487919_101472 [Bacillus sp. ok061]|uniref:hypothetical protein n=1 Tax=Bacillus sp. ok061 TaxID=1761766 RepID=UPI00089E6DA8|nr:hypothetical protein [Bacillus sp. ok061]SEF52500.1 hypothetical protein SAMN04487919_101472 [Bacillus sp. ok061]